MKARPFPAPAKFNVREYAAKDFETLYAIDQLCYSPAVAYTRAELRWYLGLQGAAGLVAVARRTSSAAAGIAGFVITTARGEHGHIITIDVLEMYRRKGVASALLRRAEAEMKKRGVQEVWLETATNNEAAIAFWRKHGYRVRGRLPNYYPEGMDAFAMSKLIARSIAHEN
ncbi:MAG TPA: N-acetyltransferase [Candidatus Acidoferrales bacterium]|nr:N-acetyltransferase [Candidatus Acidoferrales bacterium]